jgi:hypothetical protein
LDFFQLRNPSSCTMALGSTQPLTEMSTRLSSWGGGGGKGWPAYKTDNLTTMSKHVTYTWGIEVGI